MHRNEDAIREARRAVELDPESQDAFHGAITAGNLAMAYALVGEPDQAITLIAYGRNSNIVSFPNFSGTSFRASVRT
jgi:subtilisin family serine protease